MGKSYETLGYIITSLVVGTMTCLEIAFVEIPYLLNEETHWSWMRYIKVLFTLLDTPNVKVMTSLHRRLTIPLSGGVTLAGATSSMIYVYNYYYSL